MPLSLSAFLRGSELKLRSVRDPVFAFILIPRTIITFSPSLVCSLLIRIPHSEILGGDHRSWEGSALLKVSSPVPCDRDRALISKSEPRAPDFHAGVTLFARRSFKRENEKRRSDSSYELLNPCAETARE